MANHHDLTSFIWQIADLLRGPYRPPQYERVMLPMTVLRRFDCVLAPTKAKVLAEHDKRKGGKLNDDALDKLLNRAAGQRFHNHSPLTFEKLKGDPDRLNQHLTSYIKSFSANVRRIFEFFEFDNEIEKMHEANILYLVVSEFCDVDLHPDEVDNIEMGLIFENLIRRFNELANETAGDHFTPREVIRLMVHILFIQDDQLLATPGTVRKLLDPACGTGGMLAEAQNYLRGHHSAARLYVYGQDYNKRAFATAASDMLMKQVDHNGGGDNVRFGDSFTDDQFKGETFDYLLANPPFGVDWKKQYDEIKKEHDKRDFPDRFGAGLPRVNDGSLLFLQHMISKFEPVLPDQHKHGSRLAIVFSGSPLFTGGAGSGEIPVKWALTRLKFVAEVQGGLTLGKNYGAATLVEYPYLRVANVQDGYLDLSDVATILVPEAEAESCLLKAGDVLMNEGGDADKLGRGCIWHGEISPCLHQNHVFAVKPKKVSPEWLDVWTSTDAAKKYFESRAKQSTNLASISATNIKELPVPLPVETEQHAIVGYIGTETAKLDALREATERTLKLLKERRAALIAAAVTGKLNVSRAA